MPDTIAKVAIAGENPRACMSRYAIMRLNPIISSAISLINLPPTNMSDIATRNGNIIPPNIHFCFCELSEQFTSVRGRSPVS